jgi:2'-5' RNA ligase
MPAESLIAIDVALLPPPPVSARAIDLSAVLPADPSHEFRLGADHHPHITLSQHFVRVNELEQALARVDEVLRGQSRLTLSVTGGGQGSSSVWMAIERTPAIVELHERLLEALRGLERADGGPSAFFDTDARVRDVLWVAGYRLKSSFGSYTPHITLGHGAEPPWIEPFAFEATTAAVCHLGKFCTCRRVLRQWTLRQT